MSFLATYGRALGLLAPERRLAAGLLAANLALAGLQFLEPVLFGAIIDLLAGGGSMDRGALWGEALRLLGLWGAVGIAGIAANVLVALHADRLAHRRRLAAIALYFEHVLALPVAFHGDTHSGRLIKVMLGGADSLFGIWLGFFREHLSTFVILLVLLPLTLMLNWRLALLLMVLAAAFAVLTAVVVHRTELAQREVEEHHSAIAERAADTLTNVVVVQSFARLHDEARQLGEVMGRLLRAQFPVLTWWAVVTVMAQASATITVILLFLLGTWLHLDGLATVGEIVSFMGFATLLIGRLEHAMSFVSRLFFQMHQLAQFFAVLDTRSTVPDGPLALGRAAGAIAFEGVTFAYEGRPALHDFSVSVPAGTTVALVGATGAGKSTAMALLYRLWDPQAGRITLDGIDLRQATLESLRRNIGVVFQEGLLFHRTIADNLRVGRPAASAAELEAAARRAQAHDFIMAQPQGYDTLVGERGAGLSGGERQRLSIARALLKDPPVLILDEATSALDTATEASVQRALREVMGGRTCFVVAHRLSTIRDADLILVLDHGRIVERGRYAELAAAGGTFARLIAATAARSPS
ncbi:MAG: glucan ABC transporter ATP-binding protein/ permease [Thalassobaculales bacterium]